MHSWQLAPHHSPRCDGFPATGLAFGVATSEDGFGGLVLVPVFDSNSRLRPEASVVCANFVRPWNEDESERASERIALAAFSHSDDEMGCKHRPQQVNIMIYYVVLTSSRCCRSLIGMQPNHTYTQQLSDRHSYPYLCLGAHPHLLRCKCCAASNLEYCDAPMSPGASD